MTGGGITASPFPPERRGPRSSTIDNPVNSLDVTVSTPDDQAFGRVRGRTEVSIWFAPGWYARADDAEVARQLQRLGRLLFAARTREYYRLRSQAFRRTVTREAAPTTEQDRRYVEQRASLVAQASALDGRFRVSATGMAHWAVQLAPGTVAAVDEATFCAAVSAAGHALVEDQFAQVRALKQAVYDPPR